MPRVIEIIQIGFAGCRIGIQRCWQWLKCYQPVVNREQYQILCLGLSGAGKTSALAALVGEPVFNSEPTKGFNIKTLHVKDAILNIKELGGSDAVRPFWNRYFEGQHGVLYVINAASDEENLKESIEALSEVLSNQSLIGVPCVILATHQDIAGSKSQQEITELFQEVLSGRKWRIHSSNYQNNDGVLRSLETLVNLMTGIS